MEGVMMRAKFGYAVAVRRADGRIECESTPYIALARRHKWLAWPVLRGAAGLFEMLYIGTRTLNWSADRAIEDEEAAKRAEKKGNEPAAPEIPAPPKKKGSEWELGLTLTLSLAIGITLFVVLPNLATHWLGVLFTAEHKPLLEEEAPIAYNLISGAVRIAIIVGYIWAISLMDDVRRLFMYHGAEHKTVSAFEAGKELTVDQVRPFTRLHPRCGTTFIALVLMVAILLFALLARAILVVWPGFVELAFWWRKSLLILGHILLMPLVAGVCFEILRLGARYPRNPLLALLILPGFWFQRLTVSEPDDSMIEVAIESLKRALALPAPAAAEAPAPAPIAIAAAIPN